MDNINIRFAREEEVPIILDFIKSIASYEKMLDQVKATEDGLRDVIFNKKMVEVIFAVENDIPIGFALFFPNFSTFEGQVGMYLEDLFVKPEGRGRGIGKALITYVAKLAVERGCPRMEWQCLDWNEPSIDFYKALGARAMDEWTVYRLTGDALEKLGSEA